MMTYSPWYYIDLEILKETPIIEKLLLSNQNIGGFWREIGREEEEGEGAYL